MSSLTLEHRRLYYQCRRGTKELEQLLKTYLNDWYDQSSARHQNIFKWLLNLEDDQLWQWILQRADFKCRNTNQYTNQYTSQLKQAIEVYTNETDTGEA